MAPIQRFPSGFPHGMKGSLRLVTIPISHYCERARWALDYCGHIYDEEQHLQIFHRRVVRRLGGKQTVPILVTDAETLYDSREIVQFAHHNRQNQQGLYPDAAPLRSQVEQFEDTIEGEFGAEVRRIGYAHFLSHVALVRKYNGAAAPWWQRHSLSLVFPFVLPAIKRYFNVTPETVAQAEKIVSRHLDQIAERLADGRQFLFGDRFTAADLAFSSLLAPLLLVPQYGIALPRLEELPTEMRTLVEHYRGHPAGQFAIRMYRDHRRKGASEI